MNLVIVSGPEATGKTAVGNKIASLKGYQYLGKDLIKEGLFDSESHNTWDFSWYENKSKDEFFDILGDCISKNKSIVIESNFLSSDKEQLSERINNKVVISEIFCTTKGLTSFKRFVKRNETGLRHKGHHDRRWYIKVFAQDLFRLFHIIWPYKPTGLTNRLLVVDSTEFSKIDYDKIIEFINKT